MCCLMSDKNQAAIGKTATPSGFAELVNPLAKRLDIVEQDVKQCILVDVAVEILIATFVCNESLVVQGETSSCSIEEDLMVLRAAGTKNIVYVK